MPKRSEGPESSNGSRRSTDTEARRPNVKKNQKTKKTATAAGRRKREQEHIRSLVRGSGGRSYTISLPRDVIRAFRWEKRQKLELSVDSRRKRITISDWPRR